MKWQLCKDTISFDLICLGTSKAYHAFNPIQLDTLLNLNCLNMATGSQHISESYFILKETFKHQSPKIIVLDLYGKSFRNKLDWNHFKKNMKYLSADIKHEVWETYPRELIIQTIFPVMEQNGYITTLRGWKNRLSFKEHNLYNEGWQKGWLFEDTATHYINDTGRLLPQYSSNELQENLKYLDLIIELCHNQRAKLIMTRLPLPKSQLDLSYQDDGYLFFETALKSYDLPYYDYTYDSKINYLDCYFIDATHMNFLGSMLATRELACVIEEYVDL